MTGSQKMLLSWGLALSIVGMAYGLWYALADEHPTLERMGVSMASAFAEVAKGELDAAEAFLEDYGATRFEYVREVHAHGHLAALSTLLLLLGLYFKQLAYSERIRLYLASLLVFGTAALPLGSFLEILIAGPLPKTLSVLGAVSVIGGMVAVAAGLMMSTEEKRGR